MILMILENLRIALRAIRVNALRSILTMLGIVIGVAAVIAVVSVIQGLHYAITTELGSVGATFIRVVPYPDRNDPDLAGRELTLTREDGESVLAEVPAVAAFTTLFVRSVHAAHRDHTRTFQVLAVGAAFQEVTNNWVERGRFFSTLDMERRGDVCVIGRGVIEDLELPADPLGVEITVDRAQLTVVGVLEKKGEKLGEDVDRLVLLPITTAEEMFGRTAMKQLTLDFQARSPQDVELVKDRIIEILRRRHAVPEGKSDGFRVFLQEEMVKTVGKILGTVTSVVVAVVGIALVVGGIGIMNVMLVSVRERTREIGIRKAVGARRSDVLLQFLIEAVTLSVFGGVLGIGLGMGAGALAAWLIPNFPASSHTPLWAIALAVAFAGLVGIVFGTYPAAKAASLDPIESLRYE